jgi:hypothetical protein
MTRSLSIPAVAAGYLGISERQLNALLDSGELRGRRFRDGYWQISQDTPDAFLAEQGGRAVFHAHMRAGERQRAREFKRATEAVNRSILLSVIARGEGQVLRAETALRRVRRNDYRRRLERAKADGLEFEFRAAERAKYERKKREKEKCACRR